MKIISPIMATALLYLVLSPSSVIAGESEGGKLTTLAKEYEKQGKYDEAIQIYRHLITLDPTRKEFYQTITALNAKKSSLLTVKPSSAPTISFTPKTATTVSKPKAKNSKITKQTQSKLRPHDVIIKLGYTAIEENRLDDALMHFNQVLKRYAHNTLSLYGKALVHFQQGEWEKVKSTLSREVKQNDDPKIQELYQKASEHLSGESAIKQIEPSSYASRFKEAELLLSSNKSAEAEITLQQLYLENPSDVNVLLRLGETYSHLGEFLKAKEYYTTALSFSKNNHYAQEGLAQTLYALKEYKDALSMYEKIDRKLWDKNLDYNYQMARIAYHIDTKKYDLAQHDAQELYHQYPDRLDTIRQLANLSSTVNLDDAIRYRTIVFQKSRATDDLIALLYSLLDAEHFTQAETYFNSLRNKSFTPKERSELKKLYLIYYRKMASTQLTKQQFESAERTSKSGLLLSSNDPGLNENLGWSLLNQNKSNEALKIFEQMLSHTPLDKLYYAASLCAYNTKEPKKAYGYLFKASKTTDIPLLEKIAELYRIMGYPQEALETIKLIEHAKTLGNQHLYEPNNKTTIHPSESDKNNDLNGIYNPFISSNSLSSNLLSEKPEAHTAYVARNVEFIDSTQKLKQQILAEKQNSIAGSFFFESRSGTSGINRLTKTVLPIEITLQPSFKHSFHIGMTMMNLETGKLSEKDRSQLGFGTNNGRNNNIESTSAAAPFISHQYTAKNLSFETMLSTTPKNDTGIETTFLGYIQAKYRLDPWSVSLKALQEPIDETMVSYLGQNDPDSENLWGRVVRKGFKATLDYQQDWITSLSLGYYPSIKGVNTLENSQTKATLFLGKKIFKETGDDFLLGPLLVFDRYKHSTNHFTYGHGGYFSPTSYTLASLYGDYTHFSGNDTYLNIKGNIGFSSFQEGAEPFFPLAELSDFYPANNNSGITASFKGIAGYKLNSNIHLLGMLGYSIAPQYNSMIASASLIYYFDDLAKFSPNEQQSISYIWNKYQ